MGTIPYYPYTVENQIVIRNSSFAIAARGNSADRITDAAVIAILLVGFAVAYKASL